MATRQEVYAAIDSERDYQMNLSRKGIPTQMSKGETPHAMAQVSVIRKIIRDFEDAYYNNSGYPDMNFMRKIAGVAVRSMEAHGAPKRG